MPARCHALLELIPVHTKHLQCDSNKGLFTAGLHKAHGVVLLLASGLSAAQLFGSVVLHKQIFSLQLSVAPNGEGAPEDMQICLCIWQAKARQTE